jgi:predicted AAA+ superfamily ATPase
MTNSILRPRMEITGRFFQAPGSSFFLFGPRGTGKTTWLLQHLPGALWINLLDPGDYRELSSRPERLRELVLGAPSNQHDVVLDEVQRLPELLTVVHELIDRGPPKRYVLTGSSARKLRRGGVDLLGGRARLRSLHPFMAAEWAPFRLSHALRYGLLPLVVAAGDPADVLRAYVGLYLEQEVKAEAMVRNLGQFARFLEAVSFSHGGVLNVSAVARDTGANRKTVEGFLEVLEDLLLSFRVEVFSRRAKRATAAHPKFYLFDAGVFRSLRPAGPLDRPEEIDGAALEGLVAQHLRAWIAYSDGDRGLFTWRTRSGVEVDFVVYGPEELWAIEVKNGATIRPADVRGLRAFLEDYPEAQALLLYRGDRPLRKGDVLCLPIDRFLAQLRPGHPLAF